MSVRKWAVRGGIVGALLAAAVTLAPNVLADPDGNPCGLAVGLLCRLIPMAPDLDHDLDLTLPTPGDVQPAAIGDGMPAAAGTPTDGH